MKCIQYGYMDKWPLRMQGSYQDRGIKTLVFFGDAPTRRPDKCNACCWYLERHALEGRGGGVVDAYLLG